ncbi:hypothetical protein DID96_19665 [Burkholderia sp. Bp8963]|nr:hypothetical protein DID96_19665 [Burkholderia sp. Bp8963]
MRTYEHLGFTLEVTVESDFSLRPVQPTGLRPGYVAVVRVFQAGHAIATFSPLRYGDAGGRPFDTEVDAMMGGYSAARRIVDDLFSRQSHSGVGISDQTAASGRT